jgi:hypothetical protein
LLVDQEDTDNRVFGLNAVCSPMISGLEGTNGDDLRFVPVEGVHDLRSSPQGRLNNMSIEAVEVPGGGQSKSSLPRPSSLSPKTDPVRSEPKSCT